MLRGRGQSPICVATAAVSFLHGQGRFMEPINTGIMLAGAGTCIGALISYVRHLGDKRTDVTVRMGEVEISIRGPISPAQAHMLVEFIGRSHVLES